MSVMVDRDDIWGDVVGQDRAVAALRGAARQPVHAYLFVGNEGWGTRSAARAFAAALLADGLQGDAAERAISLSLAGQHPDLEVFEPEGAYLKVDDADEITRAAARSPVEGTRKVLVLAEFHKVREVGPKLLKTIEEPSASTVFVILADEVPDELVTIASRAVRVDFGPVPVDVITQHLRDDGIDEAAARAAAEASGGDIDRARLLATDERLALRREAWRSVPTELDDTGATAHRIARELLAHIDDAQAAIDARHEQETEALAEQIETYGQRTTPLKHLADRHKREVRRHRTNELIFGFATLAGAYRDALTHGADPERCLVALDRIHDAAEALIRNPNESLLVQALLARLPPLR